MAAPVLTAGQSQAMQRVKDNQPLTTVDKFNLNKNPVLYAIAKGANASAGQDAQGNFRYLVPSTPDQIQQARAQTFQSVTPSATATNNANSPTATASPVVGVESMPPSFFQRFTDEVPLPSRQLSLQSAYNAVTIPANVLQFGKNEIARYLNYYQQEVASTGDPRQQLYQPYATAQIPGTAAEMGAYNVPILREILLASGGVKQIKEGQTVQEKAIGALSILGAARGSVDLFEKNLGYPKYETTFLSRSNPIMTSEKGQTLVGDTSLEVIQKGLISDKVYLGAAKDILTLRQVTDDGIMQFKGGSAIVLREKVLGYPRSIYKDPIASSNVVYGIGREHPVTLTDEIKSIDTSIDVYNKGLLGTQEELPPATASMEKEGFSGEFVGKSATATPSVKKGFGLLKDKSVKFDLTSTGEYAGGFVGAKLSDDIVLSAARTYPLDEQGKAILTGRGRVDVQGLTEVSRDSEEPIELIMKNNAMKQTQKLARPTTVAGIADSILRGDVIRAVPKSNKVFSSVGVSPTNVVESTSIIPSTSAYAGQGTYERTSTVAAMAMPQSAPQNVDAMVRLFSLAVPNFGLGNYQISAQSQSQVATQVQQQRETQALLNPSALVSLSSQVERQDELLRQAQQELQIQEQVQETRNFQTQNPPAPPFGGFGFDVPIPFKTGGRRQRRIVRVPVYAASIRRHRQNVPVALGSLDYVRRVVDQSLRGSLQRTGKLRQTGYEEVSKPFLLADFEPSPEVFRNYRIRKGRPVYESGLFIKRKALQTPIEKELIRQARLLSPRRKR